MTGSRKLIWVVLGLWALAMNLSGFALTADPTGDGFTRGLNRISGFVGWQAVGMILALVAWLSVRRMEKGDRLRLLGRVPGVWAMLLILLVALAIAVSAWQGNRAPPQTGGEESSEAITMPVE